MRIHSPLGDEQSGRDLLVAQPTRDQLRDLDFPLRERVRTPRQVMRRPRSARIPRAPAARPRGGPSVFPPQTRPRTSPRRALASPTLWPGYGMGRAVRRSLRQHRHRWFPLPRAAGLRGATGQSWQRTNSSRRERSTRLSGRRSAERPAGRRRLARWPRQGRPPSERPQQGCEASTRGKRGRRRRDSDAHPPTRSPWQY